MRILAISNRIPSKDSKGDQIVSFNRLIYLAKNNCRIELICFGEARSPEVMNSKIQLENYGIKVHLVKWSRYEAALNLLFSIANIKIPLQVALYKSKSFARLVSNHLKDFNPNYLYLVTIRCGLNVNTNTPFLLDMVDSMGLNLTRRLALEKGIVKWILYLECMRVSSYEKLLASLSKNSFLVSRIDAAYIRSPNVSILPLGVDGGIFFQANVPPPIPTIIFTGNMNYQPNIDAIAWFISFCWDRIKFEVPNVTLKIVGANPSSRVLGLANNRAGIRVTGRVQSVAFEINSSDVAIAPMQSGSGMQFKILEAMACGIPVVATKLGLGDIAAQSNIEILLGDSPDEFADKVIELIKSSSLRSLIGTRALEFIKANHSWDAINQQFFSKIST